MAKIAFIGLGVMGFPMAGHLHKAGHEVVVYNRTTAKAENWASAHQGGTWAATPSEAVQGVDFVCLCVGRDADVDAGHVRRARGAGWSCGAQRRGDC
jgi:3-hydroxyisobutyrate dehydrogenase